MNVTEVKAGNVEQVDLQPIGKATFAAVPQRGDEVELIEIEGELILRWGTDQLVPARPRGKSSLAYVRQLVDTNATYIAHVLRANPSGVTLRIHELRGALRLNKPLSIGIDERLLDDLRKNHGVDGAVQDAAVFLSRDFILPGSQGRHRVLMLGSSDPKTAGRLLGAQLGLDFALEHGRLIAQRLVKKPPYRDLPVMVVEAATAFVDATMNGAVAETLRSALEEAVLSQESYLRIWSEYQRLESASLVARRDRVGHFSFHEVSARDGTYAFLLSDEPADIERRLGAFWERDNQLLEALGSSELEPPGDEERGPRRGRVFRGSAAAFEARRKVLVLRPEREDTPAPPARGALVLSLTGDQIRIDRRNQAEKRIREGTNPMGRQLGLLLEDKEFLPPSYRKRTWRGSKALADIARALTPKQLEAIDVALNTPDIALIQGPPGTGKTKFITALEMVLAELADEGQERSHQILVTCEQHEAVANVAGRTRVMGLPAIKVGQAREGDAMLDPVAAFLASERERLRGMLVEPPEAERIAEARKVAMVLLGPDVTPAKIATGLETLDRLIGDLLPPQARDALLDLHARMATLRRAPDATEDLLKRAVHGIRTEPRSFEDDGPLRAAMALERLAEILLEPSQRELLEEVAIWDSPEPPDFERLSELKGALIDLLDRRQAPREALPLGEVREVVIDTFSALADRWKSAIAVQEAPLARYLEDIEYDPEGVRDALHQYTAVLAATLQQSVARDMLEVRGVRVGIATFESVIVDEAARAHPLDLFIPLSAARRRIVLVGDQRQLPHMLEPDVERDVATSVEQGTLAEEAHAALRASLFGRLWSQMKAREKRDGHPRTVTLDAQFRMHPVLGEFVSRTFYETARDGVLGVRIHSPRPAADFGHSLPGYTTRDGAMVAAWIDVPGGRGQDERSGRSKSRAGEAVRIASEVKCLVEADPSLTFGVVTFYREQVTEIMQALVDAGLAEEDERGIAQIARRYRVAEDGQRERLRVGTVDAFQGKEFDVVLLSMVRSNDVQGDDDAALRRKYGHLMLENRLCVAMSRQQRLLVAVGDLAFARAATCLPAVQAFINLCEGPHGVIVR